MTKVKVFEKVFQTSRSLGNKLWYDVNGLVTRNTDVKYESPILLFISLRTTTTSVQIVHPKEA